MLCGINRCSINLTFLWLIVNKSCSFNVQFFKAIFLESSDNANTFGITK
jgi:hypothetical protein